MVEVTGKDDILLVIYRKYALLDYVLDPQSNCVFEVRLYLAFTREVDSYEVHSDSSNDADTPVGVVHKVSYERMFLEDFHFSLPVSSLENGV